MKNEILNLCDQLVAATANGVYQGIIIAILVALCLRWLVRTNAATRHAIWFCTLLLLIGLVVAHGLIGSSSLRQETKAQPATEFEMPSADAAVFSETELKTQDRPSHSDNSGDDGLSAELHPLLVALIQAQQEASQGVIQSEEPNSVESDNTQDGDAGLTTHTSVEATAVRSLMDRLLNPISVELAVGSKFAAIARILLALWVMITGLRVLNLIVQLVQIRKLKRQSLPPRAELSELFQRLSARLVTNRKVELKVSPAHRSSFLLGFLHPVVLLPAEEHLELAEAELVLRHELAHMERRDDWINLIQHGLLAFFFFHPALWWISRQLSLEREIACDDHVLQQSKRPQTYALVLANLAARMQRRLPLLAPGSSNNKTQLKERIDMILNTHRNTSPRLAKTWLALITSTAAIVAVAIIFAAPRIVLAQIETTAADTTPPPADISPGVPVADVVSVASVAGLPPLGSADNLPPTPPIPADVSVGPKFKTGGPITVSASPALTIRPDISLAPVKTRLSVVAAAPGQPPAMLAAIEPPTAPGAPRTPKPAKTLHAENRDSSLEERLDRLERMVNSLMNQPGPKGRSDFQLKLENGMIDRKEMAKLEALAKQQADLARLNPQEIEKIKEQAQREVGRAMEQAKRATAEVEKARKADQKQSSQKLKSDTQRQLQDLRRQVEALERQREKLDHQIERLEQDQGNLDEQDDDLADINIELSESKEACVTETHSQSHSHSAQ